MPVEIIVKFSAGAHVTNTVHGVRASSTMSAEQAAISFGRKCYGADFANVEQLPPAPASGHLSTRFLVHARDASK